MCVRSYTSKRKVTTHLHGPEHSHWTRRREYSMKPKSHTHLAASLGHTASEVLDRSASIPRSPGAASGCTRVQFVLSALGAYPASGFLLRSCEVTWRVATLNNSGLKGWICTSFLSCGFRVSWNSTIGTSEMCATFKLQDTSFFTSFPSAFSRLNVPKDSLIPLTKRDQMKLDSILKRPYVTCQPCWRKEVCFFFKFTCHMFYCLWLQ